MLWFVVELITYPKEWFVCFQVVYKQLFIDLVLSKYFPRAAFRTHRRYNTLSLHLSKI